MTHRVTVYLSPEEKRALDYICIDKGCSQSTALKAGLKDVSSTDAEAKRTVFSITDAAGNSIPVTQSRKELETLIYQALMEGRQ